MIDGVKFEKTVRFALNLPPEKYHASLALGEVAEWDSLAHLSLIFAIEDAFDCKFASERIPQLKSLPMILAEIETQSKT